MGFESFFDQLWDESPRVLRTKARVCEELKGEAEQELQRIRQGIAPDSDPECSEETQKIYQKAQKRLRRQKSPEVKILRSCLVNVISARFPDLTDFAQQRVEQFDYPAPLNWLIQVAATSDADAVRFALNEGAEIEKRAKEETQKIAMKEVELTLEQKCLIFQRDAKEYRLTAQRNSLRFSISARFPDLADFAQQQLERIDQPAALDALIEQVATAPDANAVRFALNAGAQ